MLKVLGRLLSPFRWWILASVALGVATILAAVGLMGTAAFLITTAALHPSIADLQVAIVGVRFFGISRGIFRYLDRLVLHEMTFRLLAQLRLWFFRSLAPLAPARLVDFQSADLLDRAVSDIDALEALFSRVISPPLVAIVVMGIVGGMIFVVHPASAGIFVVVFLISAIVTSLLALWSSDRFARTLTRCRVRLGEGVVDLVEGNADLTANGLHLQWRDDLVTLCGDIARLSRRRAWIEGLTSGMIVLFNHLAVWLVLVATIPDVAGGRFDPVMMAVICLVVMSAFEAVSVLPVVGLHLRQQLESFRRLLFIINERPAVEDPDVPVSLSQVPMILEFQKVSFAYPNSGTNAVADLDFAVEPGQDLSVVGPSGAGKSTLVHLMLRYWDPHKGGICLGGVDLDHLELDDLRRRIAMVSPRSHLFAGSIADNLRLAKPDATIADCDDVCRSALLGDFVASLPQGYETWIGEHGLSLSGGQRQRLVIARALLQDASILVLDEATAQLDALTASKLLANLRQIYAIRSIIEITHLVHQTRHAGAIIVIDRGRIVERGTFSDLMQADGLFRKMWSAENRSTLEILSK